MTTITYDSPPRKRFVWMVAAAKWADTTGPLVRAALKAEAPVGKGPRAGRMRDSIRYHRRTSGSSIQLVFNAYTPYAKYVISGTKPHKIYPVAARYLHFTGSDGGSVFVGPRGDQSRFVNHPGTKANPFNRKAMTEMRPVIQRLYTQTMRDAMGG